MSKLHEYLLYLNAEIKDTEEAEEKLMKKVQSGGRDIFYGSVELASLLSQRSTLVKNKEMFEMMFKQQMEIVRNQI